MAKSFNCWMRTQCPQRVRTDVFARLLLVLFLRRRWILQQILLLD
jgi:hypothetical protein